MIESYRYNTRLLTKPVPMLVNEKVSLPACGCSCFIGLRLDRKPPETTALFTSCDDHSLRRVQHELQMSLANPQETELSLVVEMMMETYVMPK